MLFQTIQNVCEAVHLKVHIIRSIPYENTEKNGYIRRDPANKPRAEIENRWLITPSDTRRWGGGECPYWSGR